MLITYWTVWPGGYAPADAYAGRAGAVAALRYGLQLAGVSFLAADLLPSASAPPG